MQRATQGDLDKCGIMEKTLAAAGNPNEYDVRTFVSYDYLLAPGERSSSRTSSSSSSRYSNDSSSSSRRSATALVVLGPQQELVPSSLPPTPTPPPPPLIPADSAFNKFMNDEAVQVHWAGLGWAHVMIRGLLVFPFCFLTWVLGVCVCMAGGCACPWQSHMGDR